MCPYLNEKPVEGGSDMVRGSFGVFMMGVLLVASGLFSAKAFAASASRSTAALFDAKKSIKKNRGIVGQSIVKRDDNGISFSIRTSGLKEGHAYTVWMIIMQKPGDKKSMIAVHATGGVVYNSAKTFFSGRVGVGKIHDARGDRSAVRFNGNFTKPRKAMIMFAVTHHGKAIPEKVHEQITSRFGGNCSNSPANKKKRDPSLKPCVTVQRSLPHKA